MRVFASESLNLCTHSIKEVNIWSNKSHEGGTMPALFENLIRTAGFCADAPSSKVTESHLALLNPVSHLPVFRCIFRELHWKRVMETLKFCIWSQNVKKSVTFGSRRRESANSSNPMRVWDVCFTCTPARTPLRYVEFVRAG